MPPSVREALGDSLRDTTRSWKKHIWHYATAPGSSNSTNYGDIEPSISYLDSGEHMILSFVNDCIASYFEEFPRAYCPSFSWLRFNRYEEGQGMEQHADNIFGLFPEGAPRGIPVTSIVGLCEKASSGGNFIMSYPDGTKEEYLKESGTLIMFPSSYAYLHEVTPVLSGVRDSFVTWTHY